MLRKQQVIKDTAQLPLIIYYQGNYEDIPTESIINIIESNERAANRKTHLRKIMFLSVEAIQNVQRYSAHKDYRSDLYITFCDGDSYQVVTQNLIYNKDSKELQDRLEDLIAKNQVELEELYMATVDSGKGTEKGAGLGLIEITRKSNKAMHYEFVKLDKDFSLFVLYFAIPLVIKDQGVFDFSKAITIKNKLTQFSAGNESSFYYGGDFSNTFIISLLNLFLSKKDEEKNNADKRVHHILIELIQNIKRHAHPNNKRTSGIFIEWREESIEITTHNLATNESLTELEKKVVNLNGASKEQLALKSKEVLTNFESTNGLGLIDVANLIYPNRINTTIIKEGNGLSEILFNIKISNER